MSLIRQKNERMPLAISIHYNIYLSCIFAIMIGRLVIEKHTKLYFCNIFQHSLLLPVYCIWLIAEIPRLYVGQKWFLGNKLPKMAAFLLLLFFPQISTILYISSFLQEIIPPFDKILGVTMLLIVLPKLVLAWRFLRSIITRQFTLFYRNIGFKY